MKKKKEARGINEFINVCKSINSRQYEKEACKGKSNVLSKELQNALDFREIALQTCEKKGEEIILPVASKVFVFDESTKSYKNKAKRIQKRYPNSQILYVKKTKKNVEKIFDPIIQDIKNDIKRELKQAK